ncbi:NADH-quinone oxidoreductase subunit N [Thalassomonas viridans]|uniref:NADH-quinone oxidoreductase subunit N n=1 Tax=Thalassomonas viridans TaxID=137584 RepID=A0AAF0C7L4_9GAMM|nr:NADH-quinone oxidoreductase subunit N [Thalassomonas viridans]WDE03823.1 NADH-quinone oxidoreductase subunit N [Thalassomonas viridans]
MPVEMPVNLPVNMPLEVTGGPLFTNAMLLAISPQLIIAFGIVLSLLLIAWKRSRRLMQALTLAIFLVALIASVPLLFNGDVQVTGLLKVDGYGVFAFMLVCFSGLMVALLSGRLLLRNTEAHDEYYLLLQLVILGGGILAVSDHFAALFLGFELLSLSLVGLVGFIRDGRYAVETPFKYLILSATASSFMLLGIAFIYSQTGSLHFSLVNATGQVSGQLTGMFHGLGMLLFFAGMAFKLSLVPFHFWTPDVYQGAPTPVTMLMATASKVAMFTVLMKCLFSQAYFQQTSVMQLVALVAILSMVFGNVLALKQDNLKRLLGYSSIAHMGYLLIVLLITAVQDIHFAWQSALFYLSAYVLASLSIFMVMIYTTENAAQEQGQKQEADEASVYSWQGLFWQKPLMAFLAILGILSLAGIPLSMGFIAKFYLLTFASQAGLWWLILALVVGSGIGLFYYLRIIFSLFATPTSGPTSGPVSGLGRSQEQAPGYLPGSRLLVTGFVFAGLVFGLYPDVLMQVLNRLGEAGGLQMVLHQAP